MSPRNRIYPVFIPHLGCPHACVFCNQNAITGTAVEEAMRQLNKLNDFPPQEDALELAFYGGSFTAIPAEQQIRYLKAAKRAIDRGVIHAIRLSTRPDAVDSEKLKILKQYGVTTVELGAQSMRDAVLRASGRGHSAEHARQASRMIHEADMHLVLQMMTGLPGDDDCGAEYTARQLIDLAPEAVRIYPAVIVRGTELEALWRSGEYREHTVEDAVRVCAKILPLFDAAEIPVIRLGLNPTEELSGGAAVAGAYHPALGELVRSRMLRNQAEKVMNGLACEGKRMIIRVPARQLSQIIGQKKCNILWLKEHFNLQSLNVYPDGNTKELTVMYEAENFCHK